MQPIFIPTHQIHTLFIKVSEPIERKNQHTFFVYHMEKNGFKYSCDVRIYSHYFPTCKHYFLAFFNASSKKVIIEPQLLETFFEKNTFKKNTFTLFITSTFFTLYFNKTICYIKPIKQQVNAEQIIHFVKKSCLIEIEQIIEVQPQELKGIYNKYVNQEKIFTPIDFNATNTLKHTKRLGLFCFTLLFLTAGIYFTSLYMQQKQKNSVTVVTTVPHKDSISKKLVTLISAFDEHKLRYKNLYVGNKQLSITLMHVQKNALINFVQNHQASIKRLNFNEKEAVYELVAFFKLN